MPGASAVLFAADSSCNIPVSNFFASSAVRFCWYLRSLFSGRASWVLREAWNGMRQRDFFTEYTLMSLAAIGAFYIGEYPEGVAVMLFYRSERRCSERAVERARAEYSCASMISGPNRRTSWRTGNRWLCLLRRSCRAGRSRRFWGTCPLTAVLPSEAALFNTAALTGENTPRTICREMRCWRV